MALSPDEIKLAEALKKSGKNNSEVMRIIAKQRQGENFSEPQQQPRTTGQDLLIGAAKGVGDTIKFTSDVAAGGAAGIIAGPFGAAASPISSAIKDANTRMQQNVGLTEENLASSNNTQLAGKVIGGAAEIFSPFVASRLAGLASRTSQIAPKITQAVKGTGVAEKAGGVLNMANDFIKNPRLALAKQNVEPQLEASAKRLFLEGTERLSDPVATYSRYVEQSRRATSDIKVDPAIATVGESIGDAFRGVVQSRQAVGKTMAEELKKVGTIKTDVLPVVDNFVTLLDEQGLAFDRVKRQIIQRTGQTKMTQEDLKILQDYATQLQQLGSKPTIADLDAFMSRLPREIDIYKSSKGIIGTTNAERIIKNSLSQLRQQFDPSVSGIKELQGYSDARRAYADLSDFIEEGSGFLGKVTQSGDFAKDASLAKSSVQSILNQGKKDWLEKLEELSGYPALDDSVLALQAMKDAGDFRGLSLLQQLSDAGPSTSSISQKVLDYALQKVGRAAAGTPEEQTRLYLQAIKEGVEQEKKDKLDGAFSALGGMAPGAEDGELETQDMLLGAVLGMAGSGKLKKEILMDFMEDLRRRKQGASIPAGRRLDKAIEAAQKVLDSL